MDAGATTLVGEEVGSISTESSGKGFGMSQHPDSEAEWFYLDADSPRRRINSALIAMGAGVGCSHARLLGLVTSDARMRRGMIQGRK
jgi:hypothetical protein